MIPEFKLKITIPQYKTSTKEHKKSCDYICARQKCQWAFVKSINFSPLGLYQVIKVSMLTKINKVDKKNIILKAGPSNMTQGFEKVESLFKP